MIISAASESFVSEDNDAVEKASAMEGWTGHSLPTKSCKDCAVGIAAEPNAPIAASPSGREAISESR